MVTFSQGGSQLSAAAAADVLIRKHWYPSPRRATVLNVPVIMPPRFQRVAGIPTCTLDLDVYIATCTVLHGVPVRATYVGRDRGDSEERRADGPHSGPGPPCLNA